jgi:hypothetical protein
MGADFELRAGPSHSFAKGTFREIANEKSTDRSYPNAQVLRFAGVPVAASGYSDSV